MQEPEFIKVEPENLETSFVDGPGSEADKVPFTEFQPKLEFAEELSCDVKEEIYEDNICGPNSNESNPDLFLGSTENVSGFVKPLCKEDEEAGQNAGYSLQPANPQVSQEGHLVPNGLLEELSNACKNISSEDLLEEAKRRFFQCSVCGKYIRFHSRLKRHMLMHETERPHPCSICEKPFKSEMKLKAHMLCHTNDRPFSCIKCKSTFKRRSSLNHHMYTHSNESNFHCEICGRMFRIKGLLQQHKAIHRDERPYSCEVCFKTFKRRSAVNEHMMVHSEERQFSCDVCNKHFKESDSLQEHKLIHGERKFVCKLCNKSFKKNKGLRNHLQIHYKVT